MNPNDSDCCSGGECSLGEVCSSRGDIVLDSATVDSVITAFSQGFYDGAFIMVAPCGIVLTFLLVVSLVSYSVNKS